MLLTKNVEEILTVENRTKLFPKVLWFFAVIAFISYFIVEASYVIPKNNVSKTKPANFQGISISGKAAIVYDVAKNQILYQKNADEPLPLASLTKVMTALTAETILKNPNAPKYVTITPFDISTEGDSGLLAWSKWNISNLIDYSLVVSSNDGASAIAGSLGAFLIGNTGSTSEEVSQQAFIARMNTLAKEIGLTQSKFINEHGLDRDATHVGAYGSARDMATLFKYVLEKYPDLLEATRYDRLPIKDQQGYLYDASNTDTATNQIPSLVASKTGFTDLAGGNLVIAYDAGLERPIIISVLGSTQDGRFSDVVKLVNTSMAYIKNE